MHIPNQADVGQRWIMHVDMDAFYASVEQLDNPKLKGKPVIVGGGARGVVSAASYEARRFGVHSALPMAVARRLCPGGEFVPVRMERYKEVSQVVQKVLHRFSPCVEQASVDEAYLDATGLERLFGPVEKMSIRLKAAVQQATHGLTCSVGVAPVKFLAKIASDLKKPDGLFVLQPKDVPGFLAGFPVSGIPGVGKSLIVRLESLGVRSCSDVQRYTRSFWERRFGKVGVCLWERAQGLDPREVEPFVPPKSESAETTFSEDTQDLDFLRARLLQQADRVGRSLRRQALKGKVITLKIKYADFHQISRQTTLPEPVCATDTIYETACRLLDALTLENKVRLIGVGVSGFDNMPRQLFLPVTSFSRSKEKRRNRLDAALDLLRDRFGDSVVLPGRLFNEKKE